jgi:raffinose/stachyose/melibiose transport system permease protein
VVRSLARPVLSSRPSRSALSGSHGFAWRVRKGRTGYLFILPALVLAVAFLYIPMALSAYWSFTDFTGLTAPTWVGMANYKE